MTIMVMIATVPTDAELCAAVRAGDREAADALVRRHTGLVKRAVSRRVSAAHPDADDLIQLGRLALIDAARGYDPAGGTKYSTFAHRAVGWAVAGHLRRRDREVVLDDPAPLDALPDPSPPPGDRPPPVPLPGWLRLALCHLPPRQRQVLSLLYGLDGEAPHDRAAAAARLGLTRDVVGGCHRRALANLRSARR